MTARSATPHAVVIGAGIGGLSAALSLLSRGIGVTVLERAPAPGGKIRQIGVAGRAVDAGPTVFTMKWVFDRLLEQAGTSAEAELSLTPAEVLARHAWDQGGRFDLLSDHEATVAAVADLAGPDEAEGYRAFAAATERSYRLFRDSFIAAQRPHPLDIVNRIGLARLPELFAARPMNNMWRELGRHFRDPRLRQLFGRYATYCGSSPLHAPATLMLIAHVEREGVWLVRGGMQALASALARLIAAKGGALHFGRHVERIEAAGGRATAVVADGERIGADLVVFNGDAAALSAGLLGPDVARATRPVPRARRSLSAMVWSAVAPAAGFPLSHHTVFFSADYPREFGEMFGERRLATDPTVYVCAQDRGAGLAETGPEGPERLHIQINAPADGDIARPGAEEREACQQRTFELMARAGLALELTPSNHMLTTAEGYESLFPGTGGALYGGATHGALASFSRPAARTAVPGLYLAGGSAHPGAGVPMAAMSGMLAAERAFADLASTQRFRPAATAGGISTGSRRTEAPG